MIKLCDKYCDKCVYRGSFPGVASHCYCRYLDITGSRRPCPAGSGCTVRTTRKVKRKKVSS